MKFFTTPNSKNIIATLRIVTIEKSELTFLLILYFHDEIKAVSVVFTQPTRAVKAFEYIYDGQ